MGLWTALRGKEREIKKRKKEERERKKKKERTVDGGMEKIDRN
jgi:hypothetical protein